MALLASLFAPRRGATYVYDASSMSSSGIYGWARSHKMWLILFLLVGAAAAIAQQAYEGHTEWFDSSGQESSEAVFQFTGLPSVPDQTRVNLMTGQPVHNAEVGAIGGEAGVSGGAATYSIPIVVPPGRRGMQPELALSYSSRAGNGIAGMGWSLSGLSSISRCPATLDQDGLIRPVQMDAGDKLCLDGTRLIATSGVYGQANTRYSTEIESFSRITQLSGSLSSANASFKVETKSGDVLYVGETATSRVTPLGNAYPLSWLIDRRIDRAGNNVRYIYTPYGYGENLLASVLYTGFGSLDGDREVVLSYQARPIGAGANDQSSSYLAGGLTKQTQRLESIVTKVGLQSIRSYTLGYQTSTASLRSLLSTITECGFQGTQAACRPATSLAWQARAPTYAFGPVDFQQPPGAALTASRLISTRAAGDFNGDGATDYLVLQKGATNPGLRESFLVSFAGDRSVSAVIPVTDPSISYSHAIDFDLDGRTDYLTRDSAGQLIVRLWHGPSTATTFASAFTTTWATGITGLTAIHAGDMDGDSRADVVMLRANPSGPATCGMKIDVHRNTPGIPGAAATFPLHTSYCLAQTGTLPLVSGPVPLYERLSSIRDFNGDGLMDLLILKDTWSSNQLQSDLDHIAYGQRGATLTFTNKPYAQLFPSSDPAVAVELNGKGFSFWTDLNGDGLDDLVRAHGGAGGSWTIRLNTGVGLTARIVPTGPGGVTNFGIEHCSGENTNGCNASWGSPWYAKQIKPMDIDSDGRTEILVPRRFALRACVPIYADPAQCPNPLSNTEDFLTVGILPEGSEATSPIDCQTRYMCSEDPRTGVAGLGDGRTNFDNGDYAHSFGLYKNGLDEFDRSQYFMSALRLVEVTPSNYQMFEVPTNIVGGNNAEDTFGDGLQDMLVPVNCKIDRTYSCTSPVSDASGVPYSTAQSPRTYPGGFSFYQASQFINENMGASPSTNPDGLTPQASEVLSMVTDGLGVETVWTYYPLSSKAGRVVGQTPLYSLPVSASNRYPDDRHFYFTSSMLVVSDMAQSDGLGDYRSVRYGYGEAMYHARGRGFQGFRTIIEEDETAGTRTTTTFHQKFPLTSQPEQIVVSSLKRDVVNGMISRTNFVWRCDRSDRSNASACVPPSGTATVRFPFLDLKQVRQYDAANADNPLGGGPMIISGHSEYAADSTSCDGTVESISNLSGYDAYGNLTQSTITTADPDLSGAGFHSRVKMHCSRTRNQFAPPDAVSWWVDRLNSREVTTTVEYNATYHPLPVGVSNPSQTVNTTYTWNSDRTPATETLQPGVAYQQRITTYGYPIVANHGLPASVKVEASGDTNGSRTVATTYSDDGYFPLAVKNPLNQATTTVTRPEDGQPASVTDVNNLKTSFYYDAFGLAVRTEFRGANDEMLAPDKHVIVSWCSAGGCVANGMYFIRSVQDGTPTTGRVRDQLGRELRSRTRLMDDTDSVVDTRYDARGLVTQQSAPYRSGDTTLYWTTFAGHDVLGRVKQKRVPQANHDGRGDLVTNYTYSGRQTAVKICGSADADDSRCLNLFRTMDSLGRYVETVDAEEGTTKFWYDGSGNALAIEDANGTVIKAVYNALGQRTSVNDPNQGAWSFGYNALGEVRSQIDARNITTAMLYDKLGRPTERKAIYAYDAAAGVDTVKDLWTYDPTYGKGLEASNERIINSTSLRKEITTYDPQSRPIARNMTQLAGVGGQYQLVQETAYDSYYGRPKAQSYGNGETLWLQYSKYGDVVKEADPASFLEYRKVATVDARGNPLVEVLAGGNLTATRGYQPQTGQVASIRYGSIANPNLRRLNYQYDVFGNLGRQSLNADASSESYTYDTLHRLTEATRLGAATGTVTYAYDAVGNFKYKSDFSRTSKAGWYNYEPPFYNCGGGPNAVKQVQLVEDGSTRQYCYDPNGNLISDSAGLAMQYDHTQRPIRIGRGAVVQYLDYGPDGRRFRRYGSEGETQYFPGVEQFVNSQAIQKTYVGSSVLVNSMGGVRRVDYLLTDRLGSVDAIANGNGVLIETRGYDAFGKPRTGTWANAVPPRIGSTATTNTPHGFTGHEHLDSLELIHMNGRVYDYSIGRFTGVDPVIQFPLNSQSMNPYSYILNNPLSSTDPTGYAAACGKNIADGEVCEVEVTQRVKEPGSNIRKSVTTTYTLANNGGVLYAAQGTGGGAYKAIENSMIGAPNTRSNGPFVGPVPMKVSEHVTAGCARYGACDDNPASLVNPNEPSGLAKAWGEVKGAFSSADQDGLRYNTATNSPVANPTETRQNVMVGILSLAGPGPKGVGLLPRGEAAGTEVVQRAMSRAELRAMQETGLIRGGRAGTHFVSDAVNTNALRARLRMALPQTPEVRVTMQVPRGHFSSPSRVEPRFNMPGGGMERMGTGQIPVRVLRVDGM